MDRKKKWFAAAELTAVILITAAVFVLGKRAAMMERGYSACGGEYLLILLPVIYYIVKAMRGKHP